MSRRAASRRLRSLNAHLAASAVEEEQLPIVGSGPGGQGFGPRSATQPPHFECSDIAGALEFFQREGFVVFKDALSEAQLVHINDFCDRTQRDDPVGWEIPTDGRPWTGARYSQPFLDTDELDYCAKLDTIFPFVSAVLGEGNERFSEFNLRDTPPGAGSMKMGFHHDAALGNRVSRKPYHPCDWICSICYLTDVGADEPAFAVVPRSVQKEPIEQAKIDLKGDYIEQPLYGPAGTYYCRLGLRWLARDRAPPPPLNHLPPTTAAGTCVFYDIALYHTRLDSITGNDKNGRRTMHEYYARGGTLDIEADPNGEWEAQTRDPTPLLTNWVMIPERMAMSSDPVERRFYSHWNLRQCEWAGLGFPKLKRKGKSNSHYVPDV